ncbi:hypothetical protein [Nocardioides kribbensis]|uniref:Uncharacterized protein n=1 Tax=Nocardioides kribbensis TaxID=305517 RepID=A0ABV1NZ52_9ACTN
MKREWKPGDVAWLTIHGKSAYLGMRSAEMGGSWVTATPVAGVHLHGSHDVSDARLLVVIDPEDREQIERLTYLVRGHRVGLGVDEDTISGALREFASPTPPKPEEPTGLGAVVEDADGKKWFRMSLENQTWPGEVWQEQYDNADRWSQWQDIAVARVLSKGVAS